jgi:uncharacterized membrane protein YfcA
MEVTLTNTIILFIVGIAVGFVNVIAGGGSLISIPVLIFMGFPPNIANATSRVGIFFQNVVAVGVYKNSGFKNDRFIYMLTASALIGSVIGTFMAVNVNAETFNIVLAVIMLLMFFLMILDPKKFHRNAAEQVDFKSRFFSILIFFFIGIYGGFLQAGTAILIMAVLNLVNNLNLVKVNYMKVFVVLAMNILSLIIFHFKGIIDWKYGLIMAAGTSIGGYYGTVFSIKKGEVWIKRIVLATILAMAVKLLYEQFGN